MNQLVLLYRKFWRKHRTWLMVAAVLLLTSALSLAQTNTPVPPTAVPTAISEINIPTGDMIGSLNNWLEIFAPVILFLGMIPVALGLLQYIVRMFRQAFGGGD